MTPSETTRLRTKLGEPIPPGGSGEDTLLSDETIKDLLARHETAEAALYDGWQLKAAALANLVDTRDGDSSRTFSQLHTQALAMVKQYAPSASSSRGRTRINKLSRS